jgi:hypothetical protein
LDTAATLSNGNLTQTKASADGNSRSTFQIPSSGLWYVEATATSTTNGSTISCGFGLATASASLTANAYNLANAWNIYSSNFAYINRNGTPSSSLGFTLTAGDVVQVAVDPANNRAWIGRNDTWYDSGTGTTGNPSSGSNPTVSSLPAGLFIFANTFTQTFDVNFGQRPFVKTVPSGFLPLNSNNLPMPTIPNGAKVMAATLYTGNGSSQSISNSANNTLGVTFQPDLVWQKARSAATDHIVYDTPRASNYLVTNTTAAEVASGIVALTSTGFNVGSGTAINANGTTYVGWQWNAGSGVTSTNTDGTVTGTVTTCVNKSAGFSVVTFTSSSPCTVGHGLGVAPSFIILKSRNNASGWSVYHSSVGNTGALNLQATTATSTSIDWWSNTSPTSLVFSIGANIINSWTWVAYCWTPIAGYSSFGSFTGNGSADGPMIFTNMRPRYLFIKRTDSAGTSWWQVDSSCNPYNVTSGGIELNTSSAESSGNTWCDFLSNGFKIRTTSVGVNASGGTYIYAAFAENPFKLALAR